ncbi:MAG: hypothetical protein JWP88_2245 [Flaviaesturariibacter sp.]|nr:hypothetical protein [Flaviaesturariibacter sp.]
MKYVLLAGSLACASFASAQTEIKLEDISKHVGDSVKVCAKVVSSKYLNMTEGGPTMFYLGAAYPKQTLTLVVWKKDRKFFKAPPELTYAEQDVCAVGKIELVGEKPQIVLYSEKQIQVKEEEDDQ